MSSLQHIEQLGINFFRLFKSHPRLFNLEWKLAKLSVAPLIFLLIGLFILTGTTWTTFLALMAYVIYFFTNNLFFGLGTAILFNLILIGIVACYLKQMINQMQFTQTREQLKKLTRDMHHVKNAQIETTN